MLYITPSINNADYYSRKINNKTSFCSNPADNDNKISKKKASGIVIAASLSAATLGIIAGYRTSGWKIGRLTSEVEELTGKNRVLEGFKTQAEELTEINKTLKKEIERAREKFSDIFEGDLAPKDVREKLLNKLKAKIEKGEFGYDIATPPVTGKKTPSSALADGVPLPSTVGTTNRAGIRELRIPEISTDGRFNLEIPKSSEMQITHMPSANFTPVKNQLTNISEDYADSVQWNSDKIARDLMQNFFDGHGQTLDGVVMNFVPVGNGKFKVRIEGKSTYTPDKAAYIGESTKRNDPRSAGNYGEGIKMATLKLLKDSGASDVRIASDNWRLTYSLKQGNLSDKRVLAYSLDEVEKLNGNYIEFETSDRGLLDSLRNTVNRFYHSSNPHFRCPDFENGLIGIKNLKPGEKGGIYIAGQRFEVDGNYDGLDGIAIFIKEKPPVDVLDPSRDRTSLNCGNFEEIARWLAYKCNDRMPNDDKLKILKSLEKYWGATGQTSMDHFVEKFLDWINLGAFRESDKLKVKFPEKYVAYSNASDELVWDLNNKGYKICKPEFAEVGMPTIRDLMGDARAHDVVIPNDVQKKKILILKEALRKLSPSLEGKHFTPEELDTKIFLFDRKSARDSRLHDDALAEAIIDNGVSKGFWLDKCYLDSADFKDVLETALHELSHKAGGDESSAFSYKLTDVNRDAIGQMLNDIPCRNELQALNTLWNSL